MRALMFSVAAIALSAAAPASATNLLANGSFESGFSGWTLSSVGGGTAPVVIQYNNPAGYPTGAFGEAILSNGIASLSPDAVGNNLAYFSSDTANPQTLSQVVNLVAGWTYNIGFDYYAPQNGINNPNDASLRFTLAGVPIGSTLTAGGPAGTPARTWINFTSTFNPAASGPQTLAFEFRGLGVTAADFGIDRVFITPAVPEPGTWAMMLLGFGAIGYGMRRQRSQGRLAIA